ncbi:MAG TPA: hypothetical protein VJR48_16060 [Ktedonobacterales bacterium]|nr:hypothetical protein [Ktedonobacterales bacterium]
MPSNKTQGQVTGRQKRTDVSRLCDALFGTTPLAAHCYPWAIASQRFAAFLDLYQGKIGKKLRGIGDDGGYLDLLAELDVAHRLLTERGFTLVYEPYLAERQRGPDFAVTFKTHTTFTVEVRHLRPSDADAQLRLETILADKLRQLQPSTPNVLALVGEPAIASPEQVQAALDTLAAAGQRKDDAASRRRGFADARDLLRRMERLSAVAILAPSAASLYAPPRARHPLPPELRKTLARAFGVSLP